MSAEVSFTKRAAAELSRCFNGLTVSRNGNKKSSASTSSNTSSSNKQNVFNLKETSKKSEIPWLSSFTEKSPKPSEIKSRVHSATKNIEDAIISKSSTISPFKSPAKKAPKAPPKTFRARRKNYLLSLQKPRTLDELLNDSKFLLNFFFYFSSKERCTLAQVCSKWKDLLYSDPIYWNNLTIVIYFNELRRICDDTPEPVSRVGSPTQRRRLTYRSSTESSCDSFIMEDNGPLTVRDSLYSSIERRGLDSICLFGATDNDVINFASRLSTEALHRIKYTSLKCSNVKDKGLTLFLASSMDSIIKLELSGCNEISDSGLWARFVPRLESLKIVDCKNIADETLAAICKMLPGLKKFTLQAYHVTDSSMALFGSNPARDNLMKLHLLHCLELSNQGVLNIAHGLPNLTNLSLSGCSKVTDDAIEAIAEQLRSLNRLDLSWCSRISDAALEYIACDLSDTLNELILDRCIHVTDIGLGYLATMGKLSTLSLRWCPQIRDFGLQTLLSMESLKVISLAGCPQLTLAGLSCLVQMPQLVELELTNCPGTSKDLLKFLKFNLPYCNIII